MRAQSLCVKQAWGRMTQHPLSLTLSYLLFTLRKVVQYTEVFNSPLMAIKMQIIYKFVTQVRFTVDADILEHTICNSASNVHGAQIEPRKAMFLLQRDSTIIYFVEDGYT